MPVKRKGTINILKLLDECDGRGSKAGKELIEYIGKLETSETNLLGLLKGVQLPKESFQLEFEGYNGKLPIEVARYI